ncbi:MAG: hypothetical protein LAO03_15280 [Acidobacteriia bacterium]|nr:hypothetical protein [Terriglobia bacterium]
MSQHLGLRVRRSISSASWLLSLMLATAIPLGSLQTDYYAEAQNSSQNARTQPSHYSAVLSMALIANLGTDGPLDNIVRVNASFLDLIFDPDRSGENGTTALGDSDRAELGGSVSLRAALVHQVSPPPAVTWESWIGGDRLPIALVGAGPSQGKSGIEIRTTQASPMVSLLLAKYAPHTPGKPRMAAFLLNGTP